jgi:hypothetical protein
MEVINRSCRSRVSDKTIIKLARTLDVEACRLIYPQTEEARLLCLAVDEGCVALGKREELLRAAGLDGAGIAGAFLKDPVSRKIP